MRVEASFLVFMLQIFSIQKFVISILKNYIFGEFITRFGDLEYRIVEHIQTGKVSFKPCHHRNMVAYCKYTNKKPEYAIKPDFIQQKEVFA